MPEANPARRCIAHNVVHMRRAPDNDAERISQVILGQTVTVVENGESWSRVEGDDRYPGWIENRWLGALPDVPLSPITGVFAELLATPALSPTGPDFPPLRVRLPILAGVRLAGATDPGSGWAHVYAGDLDGWVRSSDLAPLPEPPSVSQIPRSAVDSAGRFLGTPYLWGGTTPFGLDCSGLTQLCYRLAGLLLPRDAWMQRNDSRFTAVDLTALHPGDLIFFGTPEKITHVALQWDERHFIHASGGAGVAISEWGDPPYSARAVDARRLDPARASEPLVLPEMNRKEP